MSVMVSVIIASYNHENYIGKTLKSLEDQTFRDFEIILIDDGSADGTVEAAKKVNSRARIYTQENQGVDATRNRGIELSQGKYICFVDSDDMSAPERFEKQVEIFESDPEIGLVYSDAYIIDEKDNVIDRYNRVYPVIKGDLAEELIKNYCFTHFGSVMVRKETFLKTGLFDPSREAMGHIKWVEIALISRTYYIPEPLVYTRKHESNTSRVVKKDEWCRRTRNAISKILEQYPQLKKQIGDKAIRKRFSRTYFLSGFYLASEGNTKEARNHYLTALKMYPLSLINIGGVILISIPCKKLVVGIHRAIK